MDWVQQLSKGTDERLGVSAPAIQTTCLLHCLYLCLPDPVRFSVYVFVHLSVYLSFAYLNVFLSVCVCLCWSVFLYFMAFSSCPPGCEPRLSVCRSVGLSTCLSSFIYVCLFCRLSVSVILFVYLYLYLRPPGHPSFCLSVFCRQSDPMPVFHVQEQLYSWKHSRYFSFVIFDSTSACFRRPLNALTCHDTTPYMS